MKERNANKIYKNSARQLEKILNVVAEEISRLVRTYGIRDKEPFWKSNKKLKKGIDDLLRGLHYSEVKIIRNASREAWNLANKDIDNILEKYLMERKYKGVTGTVFENKKTAQLINFVVPANWIDGNSKALNAFLNRSFEGQKLSGNVWKDTLKARKMIEETLRAGILEGKSAAETSRILRQTLKNPNALYRRVRDKKTGKLKLSAPAKNYHPGRGVYRSAYQNALRLSATEINMAYRVSDMERFQKIPFIIGYDVHLSNAHPKLDICDYMEGRYPKNFVYMGWHPRCICYDTPVMLNDKQFKSYLKTGKVSSSKYEKRIPGQAKNYLKRKEKDIRGLKSLPYWWRQNTSIINKEIKSND